MRVLIWLFKHIVPLFLIALAFLVFAGPVRGDWQTVFIVIPVMLFLPWWLAMGCIDLCNDMFGGGRKPISLKTLFGSFFLIALTLSFVVAVSMKITGWQLFVFFFALSTFPASFYYAADLLLVKLGLQTGPREPGNLPEKAPD